MKKISLCNAANPCKKAGLEAALDDVKKGRVKKLSRVASELDISLR